MFLSNFIDREHLKIQCIQLFSRVCVTTIENRTLPFSYSVPIPDGFLIHVGSSQLFSSLTHLSKPDIDNSKMDKSRKILGSRFPIFMRGCTTKFMRTFEKYSWPISGLHEKTSFYEGFTIKCAETNMHNNLDIHSFRPRVHVLQFAISN